MSLILIFIIDFSLFLHHDCHDAMMPWPAAFVELPWPCCDSHLGQTSDGKAGPPDRFMGSGSYMDHIASGYEMKLYMM